MHRKFTVIYVNVCRKMGRRRSFHNNNTFRLNVFLNAETLNKFRRIIEVSGKQYYKYITLNDNLVITLQEIM